jgi:hypothetical protein
VAGVNRRGLIPARTFETLVVVCSETARTAKTVDGGSVRESAAVTPFVLLGRNRACSSYSRTSCTDSNGESRHRPADGRTGGP